MTFESRWQLGPDGTYSITNCTMESPKAGAYDVNYDPFAGIMLREKPIVADEYVDIPNAAVSSAMASIQKFWTLEDKYKRRGLVYKRGVLMYGPPGSGKTAALRKLSTDIIDAGGMVIYGNAVHPVNLVHVLQGIRKIEADRPLIVVFEDIEVLVARGWESGLLSILDGENQIQNVVYLATTNHIENLSPRLINRPSRFDERIFVDMPDVAARTTYIQKVAGDEEEVTADVIRQWAKDTEGFSIAHIRELIICVLYLEHKYEDVIKRLKTMAVKPKDKEEWTAGGVSATTTSSVTFGTPIATYGASCPEQEDDDDIPY